MLKINNIIFPDYRRFQDPPFFIKAMIFAGSFYALKDPVYAYRKGHQIIKWDNEKLIGLIQGLQEDLFLAKKNHLAELHGMTLMRLENEFSKLILTSLEEGNNISLKYMLNRFYETVDMSLIRISRFPFSPEKSKLAKKIKYIFA